MGLEISTIVRTSMAQMLRALDGVLQKGADAAKLEGVDEDVYLNARLASDMFPLKTQIQVLGESVRQLSLLAGTPAPELATDDKSFEDLRTRVRQIREALREIPAAELDRDPEGAIEVPIGEHRVSFPRSRYFLNFVLPNFYFHVTTAYDILRNQGVPLGKGDFLALARPQRDDAAH